METMLNSVQITIEKQCEQISDDKICEENIDKNEKPACYTIKTGD